jgi:hypothetical protein
MYVCQKLTFDVHLTWKWIGLVSMNVKINHMAIFLSLVWWKVSWGNCKGTNSKKKKIKEKVN